MRLAAAALVLAVLVLAPCSAAGATRACGRIDIDYPRGQGGASAIGIRATNLRCNRARPLVGACLDGQRPRGWRVRFVPDRSRFGGHIRMRRGNRRITYFPAGGGGCQTR